MQSIQTNGTLSGAHVQGVHKPKGRNKVWFAFFLTLLVLCIMLFPAGGLFVTQSDPTLISWCYTRRLATTILAQHCVAMLEQCCNCSKQRRNNIVMLCCAKNRRCESFRVTPPLIKSAEQRRYPCSRPRPNGLNKLPERRFEFPFNLSGKLTMAFLTGRSWRVLKSWYTDGRLEQGFQRSFAGRLNQKFSFDLAQATLLVIGRS